MFKYSSNIMAPEKQFNVLQELLLKIEFNIFILTKLNIYTGDFNNTIVLNKNN